MLSKIEERVLFTRKYMKLENYLVNINKPYSLTQ